MPYNLSIRTNAPLSRQQAAAIVTSLIVVPGATGTGASRTSALVRQHYLQPVGGSAAGSRSLTKIEMVNLLWHIAANPVRPAAL